MSTPSRPLPGRAALQRHVLAVQRRVRTCTGCGLCCTEPWNSQAILPWEAARIADHLAGLPAAHRTELLARARRAVARWGLARAGRRLAHYTCSFLQPDMSCALPLEVKPVACLSFNPLTPDACDQEPEWHARAGAEVEAANRAAGLSARRRPIPLAVLDALRPQRPRRRAGARPDSPR